MGRIRAGLIWVAFGLALAAPVAVAARSPLLEWREPVYVAAGLAGVIGLVLLFVQPVLALGRLPGLDGQTWRRVHRWTGAALVAAVVVHVGGLWIASPPDVIDALLFVSPTPFAPWGVIAMWAIFATACLAILRLKGRLRWRTWRRVHLGLAIVISGGSVVHALLILGTMENLSKAILAGLVAVATGAVIWRARPGRSR